MKTRLDKAITGLKHAIDRHDLHELLSFSQGQLTIRPKPDLWGGRILLAMLLLVPAGLFFYAGLPQKADDASVAAILWVFLSVYLFNVFLSLQKGQQNLTIDFKKQQFILDRIDKALSLQKAPAIFTFDSVRSATLKQKSIARNARVLRLSLHDQQGNVLAYIDLDEKYPQNLVAEKIRFFVELVLSTYRKQAIENIPACGPSL